MRHYAVKIEHYLTRDAFPYQVVCSCGAITYSDSESNALLKMDDHLSAAKSREQYSVKV
jgi:hypothetical protein